MSRTIKDPNACHRPRCALCHPWKHGWVEHPWERKMKASEHRRADEPRLENWVD